MQGKRFLKKENENIPDLKKSHASDFLLKIHPSNKKVLTELCSDVMTTGSVQQAAMKSIGKDIIPKSRPCTEFSKPNPEIIEIWRVLWEWSGKLYCFTTRSYASFFISGRGLLPI